MMFRRERVIKVNISIDTSQTDALNRLDSLLRTQLLSDEEVKQLCQKNFTCPIKSKHVSARPALETPSVSETLGEVLPEKLVDKILQPLTAKFSVMWLLVLGIFMIVLSSGILVSKQWGEVFQAETQSLVLLGYTLAAFGTSVWTGRTASLRLTTQMLQLTTLMLIPLNFWIFDEANFWQNKLSLTIGIPASIVLTIIVFRLLNSSRKLIYNNIYNNYLSGILLVNTIALNWLHLGWGWEWRWTEFPLVVTYVGTIGVVCSLFYKLRSLSSSPGSRNLTEPNFSLGVFTIAYGILLLNLRVLFKVIIPESLPIQHLGLSLGVCGWFICWLVQQKIQQRQWFLFGLSVLLSGWSVSISASIPWQAIAISGLGIWLLVDRLIHKQKVADLTLLFLLGLQAIWLSWRIIPVGIQHDLIDINKQVFGSIFMPWALIGVVLFPYIGLALIFSKKLRRWQQPALSNTLKILCLILGICLTSLSFANPKLRLLNLLLSSLTLIIIRKQITVSTQFIYLVQATVLATIAAAIDVIWPNLSLTAWAGISIVLIVAEWSLIRINAPVKWQSSAWYVGQFLATTSYVLLLTDWLQGRTDTTWNLMWLVVPIMLTVLAYCGSFSKSELSSKMSIATATLFQLLAITQVNTIIVSLAVSMVLIYLNNRKLQNSILAILTVGYGLNFVGVGSLEVIEAIEAIEIPIPIFWCNLLAIITWGLWLLRHWLVKQNNKLSNIHAHATDIWAVLTASSLLSILLSFALLRFYLDTYTPHPYLAPYLALDLANYSKALLGTTVLLTTALVYRNFQEVSDLGLYGLAFGVEALTITASIPFDGTETKLLMAHLGLGFITQIAGDVWVKQRNLRYRPSLHVIPLAYALLALYFMLPELNGLYIAGASLIGVGIGRRSNKLKPITYLSLIGISFSTYIIFVDYLLPKTSLFPTEGAVFLAILSVIIATAYLFFSHRLTSYLCMTVQDLKIVSLFHWIVSTGLILWTLPLNLNSISTYIWLGTTLALTGYALMQGRLSSSKRYLIASTWTYAGIILGAIGIGYTLLLIFPASYLFTWATVITCTVAYVLFKLPWLRWGWLSQPWRRSALILPIVTVLFTYSEIGVPGLLVAAAFYAWLAQEAACLRLSYISIGLVDWVAVQLIEPPDLAGSLWYVILLGGSLLYIAQVDPALRTPTEKQKRHILRSLATGLICFTALYQSDNLFTGLLTISFGILFIFAGLSLRVRAFLYIGTGTFVIQILRQVAQELHENSFLLWIICAGLGLLLVWVAATFEIRRSRLATMVLHWTRGLQSWE